MSKITLIRVKTDPPSVCKRKDSPAMTLFLSTLVALLLWLPTGSAAAAPTQYAMAFTQKVTAFSPSGVPFPHRVIDPAKIKGMRDYQFDLGEGRSFLVKTNVKDAVRRGLPEMAQRVARCYRYVEHATGRHLDKGFLLYLIRIRHPSPVLLL